MCWECIRPRVACICPNIERVHQRTQIAIVQHPRESRHPFGTVRIARLGLSGVTVHTPDPGSHGAVVEAPRLSDAVLLYPSADAVDVGAHQPTPRTLYVIDGTWSTARKVIRDNRWLDALPRVKVVPPRAGRYRIRRAPDPSRQLSTIEAIVFALQALGDGGHALERLLLAFEAMIDQQLSLQGDAHAASSSTCRRNNG